MKHNIKLAWLFGCGPVLLLILNLVLYALIHFFANTFVSGENGMVSSGQMIIRMISLFQSLFGVLVIIAIPVGIVFAIIYATKSDAPSETHPQK